MLLQLPLRPLRRPQAVVGRGGRLQCLDCPYREIRTLRVSWQAWQHNQRGQVAPLVLVAQLRRLQARYTRLEQRGLLPQWRATKRRCLGRRFCLSAAPQQTQQLTFRSSRLAGRSTRCVAACCADQSTLLFTYHTASAMLGLPAITQGLCIRDRVRSSEKDRLQLAGLCASRIYLRVPHRLPQGQPGHL